MRLFAVLLGMMAVVLPVMAADDRQLQIEMQRYDQIMGRIQEQNNRLIGDIRALQRENEGLKKQLTAVQSKAESVSDRMQQVENVNVRNIEAAQTQINKRINAAENNQYDWGGKTRDCADLGVKHQQIKVVSKPDGGRTVRFLCFDGKALHLGTEIYDPQG